MKKTVRDVILICALASVAIMCVGLFLYDYIPTSLTVSKPNQYETASTTTEVLSDAKKAQELLTAQSKTTTSELGSTSTVQTNIVLKEYTISKSDLAIAKQEGKVEQGRPDPFAEVTADEGNGNGNEGNSGSNNQQNPSEPTIPSDGTFYNSSKQK